MNKETSNKHDDIEYIYAEEVKELLTKLKGNILEPDKLIIYIERFEKEFLK